VFSVLSGPPGLGVSGSDLVLDATCLLPGDFAAVLRASVNTVYVDVTLLLRVSCSPGLNRTALLWPHRNDGVHPGCNSTLPSTGVATDSSECIGAPMAWGVSNLPAVVGYEGFPVQSVSVYANTSEAGANVGFTYGPLPSGMRLSTIKGRNPVSMMVDWTPCVGMSGFHTVCVAATSSSGVSSNQQCFSYIIHAEPPPALSVNSSFNLKHFYIGRMLSFDVVADEANCGDTAKMGIIGVPPQGMTAGVVEYRSTGGACDSAVMPVSWTPPNHFGGYSARVCFFATDSCGGCSCSGREDTSSLCVDVAVVRCKYGVGLEQSLVEVASIFGSDWITLWNLNDAKHPDFVLYSGQVLSVGHIYRVSVGDNLQAIAERFGSTVDTIKYLNYDLRNSSGAPAVDSEICIIANSCLGQIGNRFSGSPKDNSLDVWFRGVQSAYERLRQDAGRG